MLIRPATEADLPDLLEIHNHAVRNLDAIWTEREDTLEERRKWFLERTGAGFPVLVAVDEADKVLGYGTFGFYRARDGYRLTVEHSVYIHEWARARGAGRALLRRLIEIAREQGRHVMIAVIDAKNEISVRLHEQLGFISTGVLPQVGQKHGHWLDQVQMYLLLDDRTAP